MILRTRLFGTIARVCRKESRNLGVVATNNHLDLIGRLARLLGVPFVVTNRSTKLDTPEIPYYY